MLVLGIDLETTGLSPTDCRIIEVGVCLWDTVAKSQVAAYSWIINGESVPTDVTGLTGITTSMVTQSPFALASIGKAIEGLGQRAQAIVAHNGSFERSLLNAHLPGIALLDMPWIDTMTDIDYPSHFDRVRDLERLAVRHHIVNPQPHRALNDVMVMLQLMACYDMGQIAVWAESPEILVVAESNFEQKETVKRLGYGWDPADKVWSRLAKTVQLPKLQADAELFGFRLKVA